MKKDTKAEVRTVAVPMMEVYTKDWKPLGYVTDSGVKGSLVDARRVYGPTAYHVLPTIVEEAA